MRPGRPGRPRHRVGATAVTVLAALLGVSAGLVGVFDTVPYLRDVMRGSTRPHRGTWLIWSALAVVVCLAQWADGASWSLIMLLTQAVLTTAVFAVAIVRGKGGTTIIELALIAVAAAGVTGWLLSGQPLVATVCVMAADLIAAAMIPVLGEDGHPRRVRRLAHSLPGRSRTFLLNADELEAGLTTGDHALVADGGGPAAGRAEAVSRPAVVGR